MPYLDELLEEYRVSGNYPFHMPGHKRRELEFPNPYGMDITEIDGFDNLHHAAGIIKEAQQRAADLYGAVRSFYLVNGSTCGILAAICAAVKKRERVLVARNCHKAVYHALELKELAAEYLYPPITVNGIQGQITAEQVRDALSMCDVSAVIITSPTYEGVISDVEGIAAAAHEKGIPLIVDAAHGAHLGFGAGFSENPVRQGADAVIMSLHKTLPSFTQTALLHLCSDRIPEKAVENYLDIFETSSPSYLLMAGMDACVRMLKENGRELFVAYREQLDYFYGRAKALKSIHVMKKEDLNEREAFDWDDSKFVIFVNEAEMSGQDLHRLLLDHYQLQMEMVSGNYVLGMTSIMDRREGYERLLCALSEIDRNFQNQTVTGVHKNGKIKISSGFIQRMYRKNCRVMQIYEAAEHGTEDVLFSEAEGKISAGYLYLYPPGIPLIVPGELICRELLENIKECRENGLRVEGNLVISSGRIKIVY